MGKELVRSSGRVEAALIEEYELPEQARSVSVSLDRVSLPMEEGVGEKNAAEQTDLDKLLATMRAVSDKQTCAARAQDKQRQTTCLPDAHRPESEKECSFERSLVSKGGVTTVHAVAGISHSKKHTVVVVATYNSDVSRPVGIRMEEVQKMAADHFSIPVDSVWVILNPAPDPLELEHTRSVRPVGEPRTGPIAFDSKPRGAVVTFLGIGSKELNQFHQTPFAVDDGFPANSQFEAVFVKDGFKTVTVVVPPVGEGVVPDPIFAELPAAVLPD
ncbi:MAG: hypothetical protein A2341_22555 [Deltaproteobacteria bacterium RIFOXYB12_FULL_58_9]|nr:MAG: hypothetical protein A2341_22555 [Deltaproteobacteria bacterium RIFOXYB12_FULL_58_9]